MQMSQDQPGVLNKKIDLECGSNVCSNKQNQMNVLKKGESLQLHLTLKLKNVWSWDQFEIRSAKLIHPQSVRPKHLQLN